VRPCLRGAGSGGRASGWRGWAAAGGIAGSRQCSLRPPETAAGPRPLAGTSRDEPGALKLICVGTSSVGREFLWHAGGSSGSQVAATQRVNVF